MGPGKNSLAHAPTAVPLGLGFNPKAQFFLFHLIHSFSLAHDFNK
jgi:hypothetical protein